MFGMDDPYDQGGQVFGGVGQRLVPEGHPGHSDNHHQRSVRDLACKCHNFLKFLHNIRIYCTVIPLKSQQGGFSTKRCIQKCKQ